MIRSLLVIVGLILSVLAMSYYAERVERLRSEISESGKYTPIIVLKMEKVGESDMGIAIYRAENKNCYDEYGDQVLCPKY